MRWFSCTSVGLLDHVQFEMLEGMANHQRRALSEVAPNILLYAPATRQDQFINAIGYLIRRLDENSGPDNFLRHAFKLEVGDEEWQQLEQMFLKSFERVKELPGGGRRTQDRNAELAEEPAGEPLALEDFVNEPDTDFSAEHNLRWAEGIVEDWKGRCDEDATQIGLAIAGELIPLGAAGDRRIAECRDPSRPGTVVGRYPKASSDDIERALACAKDDPTGWRAMESGLRGKILARVAQTMRRRRADLMGAAMADGGKLLTESDPEVSEAIDFVEFYAASARAFESLDTVTSKPKGVVVVVPPWNFPIAIPCGGVAAALAAGNTVILKPASEHGARGVGRS